MARWIEPGIVKLRRATRRDLPAIGRRLDCTIDTRFGRRLVADLGADVYVAEDREPSIIGVIVVCYRRVLTTGHFVAVVDPIEAARAALLAPLLAFAEERARRRGCREVVVAGAVGAETAAELRARRYEPRTVLVRSLEGPG